MRRPDIRQRVIEAVLDLAAEAGVDDVHLIAALALHRRMTEAELRHAVGDRVYDAFAPARPALQPRRRGPRQPRLPRHHRRTARRSRSTSGPPRATCSSTSTSTSSPWTAAGSRPPPAWRRYRSLRHHHNVHDHAAQPQSSWTSTAASCTRRNWRMGKVLARRRRQGLPDRDHAQHRHVPDARSTFLSKREWEWTRARPGHVRRHCRQALNRMPRRLDAQDLPRRSRRPHQMTSVQAGEVEAVHELTTAERLPPAARARSRARPTSSRWASPTSAPTT